VFLFYLPQATATIRRYSGDITLEEDEYWHAKIGLTGGGKISFTINVTDGYPIDVFLFDYNNFDDYRDNRGGWEYISEGSQENTLFLEVNLTLEGGSYYIVVDNTANGSAIPPLEFGNTPITFDYSYYSNSNDMVALLYLACFSIPGTLMIIGIYLYYKSRESINQPPPLRAIQNMNCLSCGNPVNPSSNQCPICGSKIS
jgi:hypothetical protein